MLCVDIGIWCDNLWNYFNWINTKSCWPFTPSIAFFFSTMKNTQTKWFSTAEELCNYHGVAAAAVAHDTFFTTQSMNVYWKGNPSVRLAAPISCYNIYEPCVFVVVSCACVFIWLMEFSPLFYVFAKDTSACLHGCRTGAHNTNLCIQTHIQSIQKHRGKPAIQAVVRLRPCATACFCALPQRVTMTHPQLAKDITSTLRIQWYTIYEHIRYAPNRYGKKGEPEWRKPMVLRFSSVVFFWVAQKSSCPINSGRLLRLNYLKETENHLCCLLFTRSNGTWIINFIFVMWGWEWVPEWDTRLNETLAFYVVAATAAVSTSSVWSFLFFSLLLIPFVVSHMLLCRHTMEMEKMVIRGGHGCWRPNTVLPFFFPCASVAISFGRLRCYRVSKALRCAMSGSYGRACCIALHVDDGLGWFILG